MTKNFSKEKIKGLSRKTLGILGGGQLGKMIAMAASNLGINVCILDPSNEAPALQITNKHFISSFTNKKIIEKFAKSCDAVTYEFENIPLECLEHTSKFTKIFPGTLALKIAQDRLLEKDFIRKLKIKVTEYSEVKSKEDIKKFLLLHSCVGVLKTTKQGYDGKGQRKINLKNFINIRINFKKNIYIIEKMVKFKKEISVIVIRDKEGKLNNYRPAENKHINGILRVSNYPANISVNLENKAIKIAKKIAKELNIIGLIAVEMFITEDDDILVNEIAPRPHNSGHWTMDVCNISQFEALVRTIFNLPINSLEYFHNCKMINILGENYEQYYYSLPQKKHKIYIYGKKKNKLRRKMGHVNILT